MSYTSRSVYEFISTQTKDPILERKTCTVSSQEFAVFQSDFDFYNKISPTFAGQKFQIPTPTLCPEERQRRRIMFRNERKLYRRKCDATGDNIISFISPDKPYPVYKRDIRFSDTYNPLTYGIDFDFSKNFAENYKTLLNTVPRYSVQQQDPMENSDYCNMASNCKNCYYLFDSDFNEDSYFSNTLRRSRKCIDCSYVDNSDQCYECISCDSCFETKYSQFCISCTNCSYCEACVFCSDCFGCSNMQNAQYCIFNEQYTKDEYKEKVGKLKQEIVKKNIIVPGMRLVQTESTIGNVCNTTKETVLSFDITNGETIRYSDLLTNAKNCLDISSLGEGLSDSYDSASIGLGSQSIFFSSGVVLNSHHVYYSYMCFPNVSYCFGCVGMKSNQYCIFNKQYTKEEYEKKVSDIIEHMTKTGEWGEFFHPSLSPFAYNETVANEHFTMKREEALARGYKRQDNNYDPTIPEGAKVIDRKVTTEELKEDEQILKAIFVCEVSGRPYRIIKQELEFYKKHSIPLPRKHPDIRHEERMKLRPGRTLYLRNCDKCSKEILSVYSPSPSLSPASRIHSLPSSGGKGPQDTTQGIGVPTGHGGLGGTKVYCESCYQQEIYG